MIVEELRSKLESLFGDVVRQLHADAYGDFDATIPPVIDSLISAAHAEGVAEGAEEERRMYVASHISPHGLVDPRNITFAGDAFARGKAEGAEQGLNMAQRWIDSEFLQGRHVISLPHDALFASILAPTDKIKKEEQ